MRPGGVEETDVAERWPARGQRPLRSRGSDSVLPLGHLGPRMDSQQGLDGQRPAQAGPRVTVAMEEPRTVRTSCTGHFPSPLSQLERAVAQHPLGCGTQHTPRREPGPNGVWARRGERA